jgi:hypothetical protein
MNGVVMRQLLAALALSALAIAAMLGAIGPSTAADLSYDQPAPQRACPAETVILYDDYAEQLFEWLESPSVPARTPYYTCVTGTVLLPGQIPPPPEYCCG